jgi:hypothetical protein
VLIKQTANRQMGLGPPAMPDDSPVKAEVMARLRRDAGGSKAGGAEDAAPGTLEVRKHRLGQLSAAIDAFRLLDDSDYLEELKEGASPEDARVIDAAWPPSPLAAESMRLRRHGLFGMSQTYSITHVSGLRICAPPTAEAPETADGRK